MTPARIIAGIGFSSAADATEIAALIDRALGEVGQDRSLLAAIAVPAFKAEAAMVEALSAKFNVDVMHIWEENLKRVQDACPSSSALAEAATGLGSVAEAAALAAAGPASRLILPRIKSAHATCALATRVAENEEVSP